MAHRVRQFIPGSEEYEMQRQSYVSSPLHLKRILDVVFPVTDTTLIYHIYRSYLWLAFIGLSSTQSAYVREGDLDFMHMTIQAQDNEVTPGLRDITVDAKPREPVQHFRIYAEAAWDLHMACSLREFEEPKGRGRKACTIQRRPGDRILRGKYIREEELSPEDMLTKTIRPAVSHMFDAKNAHYKRLEAMATGGKKPLETQPAWLHLHLNHRTVALSGQYYRLVEKERMGYEVCVDDYYKDDYFRWKNQYFEF